MVQVSQQTPLWSEGRVLGRGGSRAPVPGLTRPDSPTPFQNSPARLPGRWPGSLWGRVLSPVF